MTIKTTETDGKTVSIETNSQIPTRTREELQLTLKLSVFMKSYTGLVNSFDVPGEPTLHMGVHINGVEKYVVIPVDQVDHVIKQMQAFKAAYDKQVAIHGENLI